MYILKNIPVIPNLKATLVILTNVSNINLTEAQVKALKKGLTFCPTPGPPDKSQIWLNFKEFHRRLELTHHFSTDTPTIPNT